MTHIGEPPVAQAQRLDVLTAPQSPTEMLPALPQPRRSLAPCTTSKAMPLSGPMPNRMPQSPARPSGPAPGKQPQQQPVQEGPGQPQVFSHLAGPVATAANCAVAAAEYIAAAGNHIAALGNEGNEGVAARARVQKTQAAPPSTAAGCTERAEANGHASGQGRATAAGGPFQEQVLPTIPLPGRSEAMWSEGEDAGSASAAATAYSASAAAAGASGVAASERAAASSGTGPTAALWNPQRCLWQSPEELSAIMDDWVVAMGAVNLFGDHWRILEDHKAHC